MHQYSTFKAGVYRFLRVTGAMLLALVIPTVLEAIPHVSFDPKTQAAITAILIPTLTALDKVLRDKGYYGTSL
jgi:hypothetical protein